MMITIVATIMIMAAYFLLLYAEVGFIQKKRFASTAHKDILAVIPEEKERFNGAHIIGWCIVAIALLLFTGAITLGVLDGVRKDFGFLQQTSLAAHHGAGGKRLDEECARCVSAHSARYPRI